MKAFRLLALVHDSDIPRIEGLRLLVDPAPHAGVLPALLHGLRAASCEVCMIVAGDMPFVRRSVFEYLLRVQREEHDAGDFIGESLDVPLNGCTTERMTDQHYGEAENG